ncbi:hypothetical protein [Bacillus sp. OK048]|nr:hypothetical protein [Bacillus sp. OK048]
MKSGSVSLPIDELDRFPAEENRVLADHGGGSDGFFLLGHEDGKRNIHRL